MVVRTIKSNEQECDQVADDKLRFIIRSDKDHYSVNEVFNFLCYKMAGQYSTEIAGSGTW